jgi:transcription elongation factor GreA
MAYMTQKGYDRLVAELHQLEAVERPKASAAIAEARDKGDLSENAEYDAAKEAQSLLEMKITQLKGVIADAKIIDTSKLNADTVQILCKVQLRNVKNNAKMAYTIVSPHEASIHEGKISIKSPIAQALLNRHVGDVVEVRVPAGVMKLRIDSISLG